jgi:hypothetical protein
MTPILGIIASSFRSAAGPDGAFDALATVTLSAATSTITFAGIPNTYKHLQIRFIARSNNNTSDGSGSTGIRLNSDSGSNYAAHQLSGNGASATSEAFTSQTYMFGYMMAGGLAAANTFGAGVIDILDYSSTNKNKTLRTLSGFDNNGTGTVRLSSGLWMNTSAVTNIFIDNRDGWSFTQHSQFTLYGVK